MIKRLSILLFSIAYAAIVLTTFAADRLAAAGKVDIAIKLDPGNAELYFRKYELLSVDRGLSSDNSQFTIHHSQKQRLQLIKHAIDLRPFWPEYHLYYADTLSKMTPEPNVITRALILEQLKQAYELKPYSPAARKIYEKYVNSYE